MAINKEHAIMALEQAAKIAEQDGKPIINRFGGEYQFLSNFYEAPILYNGITYRNAEAAYQAQKCTDRAQEFANLSAKEAKRLGRKVSLRADWDSVRIGIMHNIVRTKFSQHEDLRDKLLATYNKELIEGNYWNDCFWGVCMNEGENNLGKILMLVREELM